MRLSSFKYAFTGLKQLILTERNAKVHVMAAILAIALGLWLKLSATEWCLIILCVISVLGMEGVNTCVELLADFIHPEKHDKIKIIKDIAAGAVLIAASGTAIIGLIIFTPKLIALW